MSVVPFASKEPCELTQWLKQVGILKEDGGELVTRVIIDMRVGHIAKVYIERYADRRIEEAGPMPTNYEIVQDIVEVKP